MSPASAPDAVTRLITCRLNQMAFVKGASRQEPTQVMPSGRFDNDRTNCVNNAVPLRGT